MNDCVITEIENKYSSDNINIYPNPTNGIFTIHGRDLQSVEITNINGQIIEKLLTDKELFTADLREQATGIYLIKIKTSKGMIVKKIILE